MVSGECLTLVARGLWLVVCFRKQQIVQTPTLKASRQSLLFPTITTHGLNGFAVASGLNAALFHTGQSHPKTAWGEAKKEEARNKIQERRFKKEKIQEK